MDRADRSKVTEFASFSLRWSSHQSDRRQVIESKVLSWRIMLTIVCVPVDPPPSLHQPPRLPSLLFTAWSRQPLERGGRISSSLAHPVYHTLDSSAILPIAHFLLDLRLRPRRSDVCFDPYRIPVTAA